MLSNIHREKILNDSTFFTKYGDMRTLMWNNHPLQDNNENDGHPSISFCKWWAKELYDYCQINFCGDQ